MMGTVPHNFATRLVKPKPEAEVEVLVGDEVDGASEGVIMEQPRGFLERVGGFLEQPRGFYVSG
jgi:hypothetical protein